MRCGGGRYVAVIGVGWGGGAGGGADYPGKFPAPQPAPHLQLVTLTERLVKITAVQVGLYRGVEHAHHHATGARVRCLLTAEQLVNYPATQHFNDNGCYYGKCSQCKA